MPKKATLTNRFVLNLLLISFGIVFFLCFIDEGYYDLRWMASIGNWIVFFIYWLVLFCLLLAVGFAVKRLSKN